MKEYTAPRYKLKSFHCPLCEAFAQQEWHGVAFVEYDVHGANNSRQHQPFSDLSLSTCVACKEVAIWYKEELIHPVASVAPQAVEDMPPDIAADFNEAREVLGKSPRASAALLRLVIQKLCIYLGGSGKYLDEDIKKLVEEMALPTKIAEALRVVRIIGNNAVHPGLLDLNDKREIALELFRIVNLIVEAMITMPKKIDQLSKELPPKPQKGQKR